MSISVQNISKFYGNQKALDQVSFSIKKGEIVGFLGPNGAGKSTMMKILTTYINSSEGAALVNGFNVLDQEKEVKAEQEMGRGKAIADSKVKKEKKSKVPIRKKEPAKPRMKKGTGTAPTKDGKQGSELAVTNID